jgi:NDP-sugar pyrophosphorylase family protein
MQEFSLGRYIASFGESPLAPHAESTPWSLTNRSEAVVRSLLSTLDLRDYAVAGDIAIHRTATLESGAVLKGPLIVGPHCFVAAGAYLRGGNWVDERCTFGPGAELKSSFVFAGTKLAHFNFVGDSILGRDVNLEAGSIVANYRNERAGKEIRASIAGALIGTGVEKFGALVGDGSRIGANAVLAPGALLTPGSIVRRLQLLDQEQIEAEG